MFDKTTKATQKKRSYDYDTEGLKDEELVLNYLHGYGHEVLESEAMEDITLDIDAYLNGVATSIKAQHAGVSINRRTGKPYNNIYFELCSQHYSSHAWDDSLRSKMSRWDVPKRCRDFSYSTYNPSWFLTGGAQQYLILQGDRLRMYLKSDVEAVVFNQGFVRVLGLSQAVLKTQRGKNTICGYLAIDDVPYVAEWTVKKPSEVAA